MQLTSIRRLSVGTAFLLLAALTATSAFAASSNRRHFQQRAGGPFGMMGGPGMMMGGPGFGGPGFEIGGPRGGGAGILGTDVLTPAASFLGVSLSTLEADLKGGKTLAQEATAKGKTAAGLIDAIMASEKTVLDAENAAGWLTDAQETSVLANLKDAVTELVNNGPPVPDIRKHVGLLDTAATYLGMTVSDLQAALKSGKTLADEAAAKGKTVDGLVQALVAPTKTELDKRVTAGDITQAQENAIISNLTSHLTDLVNGKGPTRAGLKLTLRHVFLFHR
jgi:phage FluMu protein gp41